MNGLPPLLASNDEARALVKFWLQFSPPSVALWVDGLPTRAERRMV